MGDVDKVELSIPAREEYARILRLTVAGIGSRMNFNFDRLEDLKMGLEEAYLLALSDPKQERFDVVFEIYPNRLVVLVTGLGTIETIEEEQSQRFGFSILSSVMDKVEWIKNNETRDLRMVKNIQ